MTTQPTYDRGVDHLPLILTRGLPAGRPRQLTWVDVGPVAAADPWWDYELYDGSVFVGSAERRLSWTDVELYQLNEWGDRPWVMELIDGALIVSPNAPSVNHQDCVLALGSLLRGLCPLELKVMIAPFSYSYDEWNEMQPDVLVARRPVDRDRLRPPPVLAIEVLSPSTRRRDLVRKREIYQRQGVQHYWIVEPNLPLVTLLALDGDGVYRERAHRSKGERVEVTEPFAIAFEPGDLLDD